MSWFDAAGLANIAKSALKEAQKTIDRALDIQQTTTEIEESVIETSNVIDFQKTATTSVGIDELTPSTETLTGSDFGSTVVLGLPIVDREPSPPSTDDGSSLVKIGANNSGQTSGDELETATSSDIEIIPSPNGDTPTKCPLVTVQQQKFSVLRNKFIKGHTREPSEASSISDDCNNTNSSELVRRLNELTDALEARDLKLTELNQRNVELQTENRNLKGTETNSGTIVMELRTEGEKLSKQNLHLSNVIKKLRQQQKLYENSEKTWRIQFTELNERCSNHEHQLSNRDEAERKSHETVRQLTNQLQKTEMDRDRITSDYDDLSERFATVRQQLDAVKIELNDRNRTSSELVARDQLVGRLTDENRTLNTQLVQQTRDTNDLRQRLQQNDEMYARKTHTLRTENAKLLESLNELENRNEDLTKNVVNVSSPLLRQLEQLQTVHTVKVRNYEQSEVELRQKCRSLQSDLEIVQEREKSTRETLQNQLHQLEEHLTSNMKKQETITLELEGEKSRNLLSEQDLKRNLDDVTLKLERAEQHTTSLNEELQQLKQTLSINNNNESITNSISTDNDIFWTQDDILDVAPSRYTNMFEIQMLQSSVKQRDGELQQMQWELKRRDQERNVLNAEISGLLTKLDAAQPNAEKVTKLERDYDVLCQLYGEKVEENEELKLDLEDLRDMYKRQLEELLKYKEHL